MIAPDDGAPEATSDELAEASEALATSTADPGWAELLQYLHVARGFDFQGYKPTTLAPPVPQAYEHEGHRIVRCLPGVHRAPPGRVRSAVQHHPDQRHQLLPRPGALGGAADHGDRPGCSRRSPTPSRSGCGAPDAPPGEEAYTIAMMLAEEMGVGQFRRAGQDLRHRRGRGCTHVARHATYYRQAVRRTSRRAAREVLRAGGRPLAFRKDLRRRSSSAVTTSSATRRSPGSTSWSAATP